MRQRTFTPCQFERHAGSKAKKWKISIKLDADAAESLGLDHGDQPVTIGQYYDRRGIEVKPLYKKGGADLGMLEIPAAPPALVAPPPTWGLLGMLSSHDSYIQNNSLQVVGGHAPQAQARRARCPGRSGELPPTRRLHGCALRTPRTASCGAFDVLMCMTDGVPIIRNTRSSENGPARTAARKTAKKPSRA